MCSGDIAPDFIFEKLLVWFEISRPPQKIITLKGMRSLSTWSTVEGYHPYAQLVVCQNKGTRKMSSIFLSVATLKPENRAPTRNDTPSQGAVFLEGILSGVGFFRQTNTHFRSSGWAPTKNLPSAMVQTPKSDSSPKRDSGRENILR